MGTIVFGATSRRRPPRRLIQRLPERGLPEVPNGLALCKLHHSAYDVNILGVSPDYRVHIRADVLREHDGPMLKWGLQEMAHRLPAPCGRSVQAALVR